MACLETKRAHQDFSMTIGDHGVGQLQRQLLQVMFMQHVCATAEHITKGSRMFCIKVSLCKGLSMLHVCKMLLSDAQSTARQSPQCEQPGSLKNTASGHCRLCDMYNQGAESMADSIVSNGTDTAAYQGQWVGWQHKWPQPWHWR